MAKERTCGECYVFQVGRNKRWVDTLDTGPCGLHDRIVLNPHKVEPSLMVAADAVCVYGFKPDELLFELSPEEIVGALNRVSGVSGHQRLEPRDVYLKRIDPRVMDKLKHILRLSILKCGDCLLYSDIQGHHKREGRCSLFDSVSTFKRDMRFAGVNPDKGCRYGFREGYDFSSLTSENIARIANRHKQFFPETVSPSDVNVSCLFPYF